jgi:hypothetical protein
MWGVEHGIKLTDDEVIIIHDAYNELSNEDQETVARIFLNDIKECYDNPLSTQDLSKLKSLNSIEIIKLKSWIVKLASLTVAGVILIFVFLLAVDLFPGIVEGVLNFTDWEIDTWSSIENGFDDKDN